LQCREYQLETAADRREHSYPELERQIIGITDHSQKEEYSHPELERRIVSITDYSQIKEYSPPELERKIVGIKITTKENSQTTAHTPPELQQEVIDLSYRQQSEEITYQLNYKKKLLVLVRDNSQEKTLASWIAEKGCWHQLEALKKIARRQSTYRLRFLASVKDNSQETDRALTFWITEKCC
jgi:hypothetical protein